MKRPDSCSACMFARAPRSWEVDYGEPTDPEQLVGILTCRRRAPSASFEKREAWWPIVANSDWCGDGQVVDEGVGL
jgi:hypothetical protein